MGGAGRAGAKWVGSVGERADEVIGVDGAGGVDMMGGGTARRGDERRGEERSGGEARRGQERR